MAEMRSRSKELIHALANGERFILTYRGKKVATLIPETDEKAQPIPPTDPIYQFAGQAEPMGSITNEEIDQLLYV